MKRFILRHWFKDIAGEEPRCVPPACPACESRRTRYYGMMWNCGNCGYWWSQEFKPASCPTEPGQATKGGQ